MEVRYFDDTDTLYIEFSDATVHESRDLEENTLLELGAVGRLCALTVEHASSWADLNRLSIEGLAA